jgi:hypothetical protein
MALQTASLREHDGERAVVARIREQCAAGWSATKTAHTLKADGINPRYGCEFKCERVMTIVRRNDDQAKGGAGS